MQLKFNQQQRKGLKFATQLPLFFGVILLLGLLVAQASASQGCPFDDAGCQDYCGQQGCQMGYCGHFAWIQCICRRCGDEWNWYDKVRYNPDKTVNQTELDSLKLNGSAPIILTNSGQSQDGVNLGAATTLAPATPAIASTRQQQPQSKLQSVSKIAVTAATNKQTQPQQQQQKPATLTTLLIPDLSDGSKLDLNDIPDENSEKFLDYLAKNHEKLAQATSARLNEQQQQTQAQQQQSRQDSSNGASGVELTLGSDDEEEETQETSVMNTTETSMDQANDDDTVEIRISSSNNNNNKDQQQPTTTTTTATSNVAQQQQQPIVGQMTRLLRMAVTDDFELEA